MQSFIKACPLFVLCLGLSTACSAVKGLKGSNQAKPQSKTASTATSSSSNAGILTSPNTGIDSEDGSSGADEEEEQSFTDFCDRAGKTKVVKGPLRDYFSKFCKNGKPTTILTQQLIKVAYDGTGQPAIKAVEDWSEDKAAGTTTGYVALGIKLPISIEDHFNKVGPKAGDEATIAEVLTASGGNVEIAKVLESFEKDGEYHVRGWTTEQRVGRQAAGLPLTLYTHTVNRVDQYELEKGSAYLYSSYVTESKELIEKFDVFTAGLKVGNDSYLLTLSRVTLKNQGFHRLATQAIQTAASDLVKQMYNAAAAEK